MSYLYYPYVLFAVPNNKYYWLEVMRRKTTEAFTWALICHISMKPININYEGQIFLFTSILKASCRFVIHIFIIFVVYIFGGTYFRPAILNWRKWGTFDLDS